MPGPKRQTVPPTEAAQQVAPATSLPPRPLPAADIPAAAASGWYPRDRRQVVLSIIEFLEEQDEE